MDQAMSFPRYESYKPAKSPWLQEVPSHWKLLPGFVPLKENKEKNIGMIEETVLSLSYGKIIIKSPEKLTGLVPESFETYQIINPNDIVIRPTDLQNDYTSLRTGIARNRGIITSAYICLRPDPSHNPAFMHYLLHAYDLLKVYYGMGSGLRQNLDYKDFKRLELCIPTRDEQDRIANFLDQKTAEIDEAIAKKQRLIELLKEQKAILINQAVTKGLNPDVPMRDSGVEWIGEVPSHWKVKKIKYCTKIFRGKFTHRPRNDPSLYDGAYPFIQTGDVARSGKYLLDYTQTLNEKGLRVSTLFPQGTVIITIAANIGDISILGIDACFPDSIVGFKPCSEVERDYLYYTLSAMKDQFISSTIKNTQMNLNVDRIGSNFIGLPSKTEQLIIVKEIEFNFSQIEQAIESLKNNIFALDDYKRIVISEAVTGKIKI